MKEVIELKKKIISDTVYMKDVYNKWIDSGYLDDNARVEMMDAYLNNTDELVALGYLSNSKNETFNLGVNKEDSLLVEISKLYDVNSGYITEQENDYTEIHKSRADVVKAYIDNGGVF